MQRRHIGGSYVASPWVMLKDVVLFSLAVPGLAALLSPSLSALSHCHSANGTVALPMLTAIKPTTPLGTCNCGNSVASARAAGCIFDILAAAWLPPHCIDADLTAEFEASGDEPDGSWKYWLDRNHTQEIDVLELGDHADDPDFRFYNNPEWHTVHCLFYWRKQQRARFAAADGKGFQYVEPSGFIRKEKSSSVQSGIVFVSDYL
ncbi:hypothetical protein F5Y19DRAFT_488049 [Xylariaceae sp. FL1651]|nr:hypothetical protein F5Y19DRAFT_488049 [Xylariaceae sp. FL1651]